MPGHEIRRFGEEDARRLLRVSLWQPGLSGAELERHVNSFLAYGHALRLDMGRHWALTAGASLEAACSCVESPGRTAMLFLSGVTNGGTTEADLAGLISQVVEEERRRDVRLVQCLIAIDDARMRRVLETAGFHFLSRLLYMERQTDADRTHIPEGPPKSLDGHRLEWITYNTASHAAFAELILATYEDSQDCPGLGGLRGIEDVVAGHKAVGLFDPRRWRLLRCDGQPAGLILLGQHPTRSALEVAYMGVRRADRGRGIGKYLMAQGLRLTRHEGFRTLTLAVDAANDPGLRMYRSLGFESVLERIAMIHRLASSSDIP